MTRRAVTPTPFDLYVDTTTRERNNPSVPCVSNPPHATVSLSSVNSKKVRPGRSISSAGRSANFSASRNRCDCPPAISVAWIIISPPSSHLCYADTHGALGQMPKQQTSYSLYRIFAKAYIRYSICIDFHHEPCYQSAFRALPTQPDPCLQRHCCVTPISASRPSAQDLNRLRLICAQLRHWRRLESMQRACAASPSASFKLIDSIT